MDSLTDLGMEKEIVFRAISLSFSASENFLAQHSETQSRSNALVPVVTSI